MSTITDALVAKEKAVLMLVDGYSRSEAITACVEKLGLSQEEAEATVGSAVRQITISAALDRDAEIGIAYKRLNSLYDQANTAKETNVALAVQRELNKLIGLYRVDPADAGLGAADSGDHETLVTIRAHLLPLALASAEYPIEEHARLAAVIVRAQKYADGADD